MVWIILALLAITMVVYLPTCVDAIAAANRPAWMDSFNTRFIRPLSLLSHLAISFVPFFVFGPWGKISRRMRPLAVLSMLWGAADIVWFVVLTTDMSIPGVANLFARSGLAFLAIRAITTAGVLVALLALLFREQRQAVEERATLAGEMYAAQQVQRLLAPESIRSLPGINIGIAFLPAREVGGDF